jgi:hypothetical protein
LVLFGGQSLFTKQATLSCKATILLALNKAQMLFLWLPSLSCLLLRFGGELSFVCFAVVALMAIKTELQDPYNVLDNWDINSVDPCSWRMVTCSADGYVSALSVQPPICSFLRSRLRRAPAMAANLVVSSLLAEVCPAKACQANYPPELGTSPGCNLCKLSLMTDPALFVLPMAFQEVLQVFQPPCSTGYYRTMQYLALFLPA